MTLQNLILAINKRLVRLKAKIYLSFGWDDKTILLIKDALKIWPNDLTLLIILQRAYYRVRNWNDFLGIYKIIENLKPGDLVIQMNFGKALFTLSKYQDAILHFEVCVKNWPQGENPYDLANLYAQLGICYVFIGEWNLADNALQTAQKMAPWNLDLWYGTLLLYQGTGRAENIIEFIDEKIKKFPNIYPLFYWKADYLRRILYKPMESLNWFRSADTSYTYRTYSERYKPFYISCLTNATISHIIEEYVEVMVECGQGKKAFWVIFWNRIKNFQDNIDWKVILIYYDILMNNLDEAQKTIKKALEKKSIPEYWFLLALLQKKQGRLADAMTSARQALTIDQEAYHALAIMGDIYVAQNDWDAGETVYRDLVKREPLFSDWLENLGRCLFERGEVEQARFTYERVVSLDPYDAVAWADLGEIYARLGKNDLAYSACERSLSFNRLSPSDQERTVKLLESVKATN